MTRIINIVSGKGNSNYNGRSYSPPKPPLPPPPNKTHKKIISLKFCKGFNWSDIEIIELDSFKEFFLFYMENHDKGLIYDVKLN